MKIDTADIGLSAMLLGAGRAAKDDVIDPAVGIWLTKRLGDYVIKGDELAVFHVNNPERFEEAKRLFKASYKITGEQPEELPLIYTIIEE